MNINTPLLVEERRWPKRRTEFCVRPLFFPYLEKSGPDLSVVTAAMVQAVRKHLEELSREGNHQEVARFTFSPSVRLERHKLQIELAHRHAAGAFPLAVFRALGRRIAFLPTLPEVWFEVQRGEALRPRFLDSLTEFLRKLEREEDESYVFELIEPYTQKYQCWVTTVDYRISAAQVIPKASDGQGIFATLGGAQEFDGAEELRTVGRCLDWQYPSGLMRAYRRDELCGRLQRLLNSPEKRPVLLLGPAGAGKTTLVHEFVYRHNLEKGGQFQSKRNTWLVSPQRLISGMSYVGQWEARFLAISKKMQKDDDWLYIDDLNGMFRAGVASNSDLSVADLLKRTAERRALKIVGEITPSQWRVFREADRGFADMFQILRVDEPAEETSQLILLDTIRRLETEHQCRFSPKTLPLVIDLTRRYMSHAAMPGKAVSLLSQLAINQAKRPVAPIHALHMLQQSSGMLLNMLDPGAKLQRSQLLAALQRRIIGQPHAIEVLADVMSIAKSRLNDPQRPLATMLFLGPTGVGKTETAKALAEVFFGSASRLLRFDMNEYVAPGSASRLTGSGAQPEGLLTSAIRRQPFAVVLLDEIEKAHPDVFDTLLQVLGEGRLTDSMGRTAHFGNAVIIMTSNLGVRQAGSRMGFDKDDGKGQQAVYVKAAEDFFRPEFFNRLDHVVPFDTLDRNALGQIAGLMVSEVLSRQGLAQRRTSLAISDEAEQWIVERGYHPSLGARAMKRAIESELVQPVARQLAAVSPGTPFVLELTRRGDRLVASVIRLEQAPRAADARRPSDSDDRMELLTAVGVVLNRIAAKCEQHRPPGELVPGSITNKQWQFLALRQFIDSLRSKRRGLLDYLESKNRSFRPPAFPVRQSRNRVHKWEPESPVMQDVFAAEDIRRYFSDLVEDASRHGTNDEFEQTLRQLLDQLAYLEALAPGDDGWQNQRCLVIFRTGCQVNEESHLNFALRRNSAFAQLIDFGGDGDSRNIMTVGPTGSFLTSPVSKVDGRCTVSTASVVEDEAFKLACQRLRAHVMELEGLSAYRLAMLEQGTHLQASPAGHFSPFQIIIVPLEPGEDAAAKLIHFEAGCSEASRMEEETGNKLPIHPLRFRDVLRVYYDDGRVAVDMRAGKVAESPQGEFLSLTFSVLPLPPELLAVMDQPGSGPAAD